MKVVVGKVSDFENGGRKIVDVNGKSVGIFRIDDEFYAIRNRCPHQFGPLCLGTFAPRAISDGPGDVHMDSGPPLLACPWHGWEYDIATGQSFMGPGRGNMAALSYDVSVLPGSELARADDGQSRPDGRIPGPYVAETVPVSVEQDYVVVEDKPARALSCARFDPARPDLGARGRRRYNDAEGRLPADAEVVRIEALP